jgi:hypothetical protein
VYSQAGLIRASTKTPAAGGWIFFMAFAERGGDEPPLPIPYYSTI